MKILMVLTYYYPHWTGLTAYAQRLAEGLAARGHRVTVVTSRFRKDLAREEVHNGVRVVRLSSWFRLSRGQVMPSFVSVVNRLVGECDVVQIHTPMLESWLVGILAHRRGRKMLMTHHGDLVMPAGGLCRLLGLFATMGGKGGGHLSASGEPKTRFTGNSCLAQGAGSGRVQVGGLCWAFCRGKGL